MGGKEAWGCRHLTATQTRLLLPHFGLPDTFMSIPPKRNHFIYFKGTGSTGTSWASLQGAILHLGQEILGKGTSHIVGVTILKRTKKAGLATGGRPPAGELTQTLGLPQQNP